MSLFEGCSYYVFRYGGIDAVAEAGLEGFFHSPVFAGVKGEDRDASSGIEASGKNAEQGIESAKFVVDRDPQGLEDASLGRADIGLGEVVA